MGGKKGKCRSPKYTKEQLAAIERLEADLTAWMSDRPKRLAHSLSVAVTAEELAMEYGVDPFLARVSGILHDWDKRVSDDELVERARAMELPLLVDPSEVRPLLHGMVAARELPAIYPELPPEVFQAIDRHTTASVDMTDLDKVLFVADGIEPLRVETEGIAKTRSLVGKVSLDDLFWISFVGGIVYVLEGGRYLYPGTLDIYNALAQRRADARKGAR